MSGPVVVGTDGTVRSDPALRFAAHEAQLRGSALIVVFGYVGPIDPEADDFETTKSVQVRRHEPAAIGALLRALDVPRNALPPHRIVCDDLEPAALLVRVAHHAGADLIVVGQQYRHLCDRLLHGPSQVSKLARRSKVPVVVVPEPDPAAGARRGARPPMPSVF